MLSASRLTHPLAVAIIVCVILLVPYPHVDAVSTASTCPPMIQVGEIISCTLDTGAEIDTYTIPATVGDHLLLRAARLTGTFQPHIRVYHPNGTVACSATSASAITQVDNCSVTTTGTYTVLLSDTGNTETGSYSLFVQRLNNPGMAQPLAFGQSIPADLAAFAEIDSYTMGVSAGDHLLLRAASLTGTFQPQIIVYHPNGSIACSATSAGAITQIDSCAISMTGTYLVIIDDTGNTETGAYSLFVQRLSNPGMAPGIAFGQVVPAEVAAFAEVDTYTIGVTAGDRLLLRAARLTGTFQPQLTVYHPNGTVACSATSAGAITQIDSCYISMTGTYTVLLDDSGNTETGTYTLFVQRLNNPGSTQVLPFDQTLNGAIGALAEIDTYTFIVSAGNRVLLRATRTTDTLLPQLAVYNPSGSVACSATTAGTTVQISSCNIATTGTYTLLLDDSGNTKTGSYTLYLQCLTTPCGTTGALTLSGQVVDPNGDPITGAIVTTQTGQSATSAFDGSYSISGIATGTYTLTATLATAEGTFNFLQPVVVAVGSQAVTAPDLIGTRRPVIFIPGIMGSYLDRRSPSNPQCNLWPGIPAIGNPCNDGFGIVNKRVSLRFPRLPGDDPIVATYAYTGVYGDLLTRLQEPRLRFGGGYQESGVTFSTPQERCAVERAAGTFPYDTLFVFAYDWRQDIKDSASQLADLIACVRAIHHQSDVDIVTHSMGGLVARRYIATHPSDAHVHRLITIAAPWLGAPRMIPIITTGGYETEINAILRASDLKSIAPTMPAVWQLAPSPFYFSLVPADKWPLIEHGRSLGYGDLSNVYESLSYTETLNWLRTTIQDESNFTADVSPNSALHTEAQDKWAADGVRYVHIYGSSSQQDTIRSLLAGYATVCFWQLPQYRCREIEKLIAQVDYGDTTVPRVSAERVYGANNYNAIGAEVGQPCLGAQDHSGLVKNDIVLNTVISSLDGFPAALCTQTTRQAAAPAAPAYYLDILGTAHITIADAFGNTTDTISGTLTQPIPNIMYTPLSDVQQFAVLSVTDNYTVTLTASDIPLRVTVRRGTADTSDLATRFIDVSVPANTRLQLRITPQGVEPIHADIDGDGIFETTITATASLTGVAAGDTTPPDVTISASGSLDTKTVTITATDGESGISQVLYSLDGSSFVPYAGPFTVDTRQTPIIYTFADDAAANRSSLATLQLRYQIHLPLSVR